MSESGIIGIVGGVGPYAGVDLNRKIFDNTRAITDQEHLEVYLLSCSKYIADRTEYLKNPDKIKNPATAIFRVIQKLASIGVEAVGIPCNTAHSPPIINRIIALLDENKISIHLVNMIEETKNHIMREYPSFNKVGLLATLGTYQSEVYQSSFSKEEKVSIILPEDSNKEEVHQAIYDKGFGIKAFSSPVKAQSVNLLKAIMKTLQTKGAEAIIMGCTEIPIALNQNDVDIPLIDPTTVLARSLIERVAPEKLT